jgi:hypothetical protein
MLNLTAIERFLEEQQDVNFLYGNCGRRIRRFIERTFSQGVARFTLTSTHEHLMQFAFNVGQMDWATTMAQQSLQHRDGADAISFDVENIGQKAGTLDVVVSVACIPEGLKDRQVLLENIAYGLRRFNAIGFMNQPVDTSRYYTQFEKLLASDFSELEDTTGYVTALAGYLNPAVNVEIDRLEAEYDKAIDSAFAYHALASSFCIDRLFNTQAYTV